LEANIQTISFSLLKLIVVFYCLLTTTKMTGFGQIIERHLRSTDWRESGRRLLGHQPLASLWASHFGGFGHFCEPGLRNEDIARPLLDRVPKRSVSS
jgi:hypothetical protein